MKRLAAMYNTLVEQCITRSITELEIAREELFRHDQDEEVIREVNAAILELQRALDKLKPDYGERIDRIFRIGP